jgi:antiviral helicase SKI2
VTRLQFIRSGLNGEVKGWKEVSLCFSVLCTDYAHIIKVPVTIAASANSSTSLEREPTKGGAKGRDFVRGKSGNVPFWPGGLEPPEMQFNSKITDEEFLGLTGKLKTIPPGFTRGLRLKGEIEKEEEEEEVNFGPDDDELGKLVQSVRRLFGLGLSI